MSIAHSSLNHFLRIPLAAEVHSRPSLRLSDPETLTHLAVYSGGDLDTGNVTDAMSGFGTSRQLLRRSDMSGVGVNRK